MWTPALLLPPNASPARPRLRARCGRICSFLLIMAGCDGPGEPSEPRSGSDVAPPIVALADVRLAPADADDCSSMPFELRLAIDGPLVEGRDLILPTGDAGLRLTVRNLGSEPLLVEPRLTWRYSGGRDRDQAERFELAPGARHELVIDLDRGLDTRAHPASLDLQLRTWHGRARGGDEFFPTVHFHADARTGDLHVYDHAGLLARHRGGDLLGTHRAVDLRDDLAGVGIAHLTRPEEMAGDPVDALSARSEGELR